jgi:hypothetical protein
MAPILPSGMPLVPGIPKLLHGRRALVHPGLVRHAVVEPSVCPAHGEVDDQVKFVVERGRFAARMLPRVVQPCAVGHGLGELAPLPHALFEGRVHDLEEAVVEVGEYVLFGPLCKNFISL